MKKIRFTEEYYEALYHCFISGTKGKLFRDIVQGKNFNKIYRVELPFLASDPSPSRPHGRLLVSMCVTYEGHKDYDIVDLGRHLRDPVHHGRERRLKNLLKGSFYHFV